MFDVSRFRISNDPEKQIHALNNSLYPKFTNTLPWPGSGGGGEGEGRDLDSRILLYNYDVTCSFTCTIYHTNAIQNINYIKPLKNEQKILIG